MSPDRPDLVRLVSLIEAAKAIADRLGCRAGTTGSLLGEALIAARATESRGGRPDEGIRVADLTTDNDK
jgi:hypothetical protein